MSDNKNQIIEDSVESGSIMRCPHDTKNPYTMILNALIRDENISPNCRWLLIYLLSNKDGWVINFTQVLNHVEPHFKKDTLKKVFNEAIEAGYMKRTQGNSRGKFAKVIYYVSESPKFKKCLPRTVLPLAAKPPLRKNKVLSCKENPQKKLASLPSETIEEKKSSHPLGKKQANKEVAPSGDALLLPCEKEEFETLKTYCEIKSINISDSGLQDWIKNFEVTMIIEAIRVTLSKTMVVDRAAFTRKILNDLKSGKN